MKQVKSILGQIKSWSPFKQATVGLLALIAGLIWYRNFHVWWQRDYGNGIVSGLAFNVIFENFFMPLTMLAVFGAWAAVGYLKLRNLLLGVADDSESAKPNKKRARTKEASDATELLNNEDAQRAAIRARHQQDELDELTSNPDGNIGPIPILAPADADEAALADQAT